MVVPPYPMLTFVPFGNRGMSVIHPDCLRVRRKPVEKAKSETEDAHTINGRSLKCPSSMSMTPRSPRPRR